MLFGDILGHFAINGFRQAPAAHNYTKKSTFGILGLPFGALGATRGVLWGPLGSLWEACWVESGSVFPDRFLNQLLGALWEGFGIILRAFWKLFGWCWGPKSQWI